MSETTRIVRNCQSCGAKIVFYPHATTGKVSPINAARTPRGNVVIENGKWRTLKKGEDHDGPRHESHFATCPYATRHRSR